MSKAEQHLKKMQMKYKSERYPETSEEVKRILDEILTRPMDYNTSAEVLLEGIFAARNFLINKLGNTGFQVSIIDLELYMMLSRWMKYGFHMVDYDKFLYPQTRQSLIENILDAEIKFLKEEAIEPTKESLDGDKDGFIHPHVKQYMQSILDGSLVSKRINELEEFKKSYE